MVFGVTYEYVGNITDTALFVGVILAGALLPDAAIVNVGFPRWVVVTQEPSWDDRNRILEICDADKVIQAAVDEICEFLVSDLVRGQSGVEIERGELCENATYAGQSVSVELNGTIRYVDLQIESVDEGDSGT